MPKKTKEKPRTKSEAPRKKAAPEKSVSKKKPSPKTKVSSKKVVTKKTAPKAPSGKTVSKKAASGIAGKKAAAKPVKTRSARQTKTAEAVNNTKENLRRLLVRKREEIVREAKVEIKKYISGENRQLVETVLDEGDLSVVDLSEDISLRQLSTHREVLMKIDTAIRKLAEGTYGRCEECGDEISEERLKILPFAIFCRDCQERRELMEKIEKEER